jgi:hypothetical protein
LGEDAHCPHFGLERRLGTSLSLVTVFPSYFSRGMPALMVLKIVPMTVGAARRFVKENHRHLPDVQGGLFAAGVSIDGVCKGVAIAGNPARVWQGTGRIVISRVASDETRNACSMLYGAICRAAQALGYTEAWTYTLPGEPGTSLRAAGFRLVGLSAGGEHSRAQRPRKAAVRPEPKQRWLRLL